MLEAGPDEHTLIERVQHGDAEAFEILVQTYEPRLLAFLAKTTGSPDMAEEVAQETLVKLFFKAHTFRFRCSLFTWICEIALHTFFDLRKQRRRWLKKHQVADLGEPCRAPDHSPGPAEKAERFEVDEIVRSAIAQLSPDHQMVILLREIQGASYDEIATVMNCSVGTIESRLFRARQKLRTILTPLLESHEL
ncbi:MAG: sigma-70 family RNA polymerase sigma factor [Planctomycetes bacterium]|nr:sigma-70 family RNA polymerase sigma factor [Planctomycetota bacterium]